MDYFFFLVRSAVEDFSRNKIRTFLTSLGILIGVSSVILLIAFGLGLKEFINRQFQSLGSDIVIVLPGQVLGEDGGFESAGQAIAGIRFDERDISAILRIKESDFIAPVFMKTITFTGGQGSYDGDLFATSEDIFQVRNLEIELGRVFTKSDFDKQSKVAVIGPKVALEVFGNPEAALGKNIKSDNLNLKVIGILKEKGGGSLGGPDFDSFVYVPYRSVIGINPDKTFYSIYIKASSREEIERLKQNITEVLGRRYEDDDFSVIEQTEVLNAVQSIFAVLNAVLVAIAAISLLVGGIGIMNIMYVSVSERVREIGIRRAVGAKKEDILLQFLFEACFLSVFGGILGLLFAQILVFIIERFFPLYINLEAVLIALGVSAAIGIFFGVFPARKASLLTPVEAIRKN